MNTVVNFIPYTIPIRALIFNGSGDEEEHLSKEDFKFKLSLNGNTNGPISNTNDTSSLDLQNEDYSIEKQSVVVPAVKTLLTKKRGRCYKNLKNCFKCDIDDCETLFEKEDELLKHKRTHEVVFKCTYAQCSLGFLKESNMVKHQKTHLPSAKRYECPFPNCGKKFTASYNQKIHYRLHTGDRPYKCDKCRNDYYDRANYKYHMRTAHLDIDMKDTLCSHLNCEHSFKTKKQKMMHHDKLDEECRIEKNFLIRLLTSYKDTVNDLIKSIKDNSDGDKKKTELIKESKAYINMKTQMEKTQKKIMDQEQYEALFLDKRD